VIATSTELGGCSVFDDKTAHLEGKDNANAKRPVKSFVASL